MQKRIIVVLTVLCVLVCLLSVSMVGGGPESATVVPTISTTQVPKETGERTLLASTPSIVTNIPVSTEPLDTEAGAMPSPLDGPGHTVAGVVTEQPRIRRRSEGLVVEEVASLPHPSCLAEEYLRTLSEKRDYRGPWRSTLNGVDVGINLQKQFEAKTWNCFKHGGHRPGYDRKAGIDLTLRNVTYYDGVFYAQPNEEGVVPIVNTNKGTTTNRKVKPGSVESFRFSGYFSMVSGNWPQLVTTEFLVVMDHPPASSTDDKSATVLDHAYFQAPTDYLSHYHVVVEVIAVTFHRLWREDVLPFKSAFPESVSALLRKEEEARSEATTNTGAKIRMTSSDDSVATVSANPMAKDTTVISSRPVHTRYGFKPKACANVNDACLETHWGRMFTSMLSPRTDVENKDLVLGLKEGDPQLVYVADGKFTVSKVKAQQDKKKLAGVASPRALRIGKLFVGNPTTCEPLWGPDPYHVEVAGAVVKDTPSFLECQRVLYDFRSFYLHWAFNRQSAGSGTSVFKDQPVDLTQQGIEVAFVSRLGDWARYLTNEDSFVKQLRMHMKTKYGSDGGSGGSLGVRLAPDAEKLSLSDGVRVVRFTNGTLDSQIMSVHSRTTLYITNHGANIVPSLYMRQNSGLVLLSNSFPGFYPFSVFPSWQYVRDVTIKQACNRRLFPPPKKCKLGEANNNDNEITPPQMDRVFRFVDEIIALQVKEPLREGPLSYHAHKKKD